MERELDCPKCGKGMKRLCEYTEYGLGVIEYQDRCEHCGFWEDYAYGQYRGTDYLEEYEAWGRVSAYIKKMNYDWTYERLRHDYLTYYLNDTYCSYTLHDVIKNNKADCRILFEEN